MLKKTILIAEDDSSIIEVMRIILEDAGYTVRAAKDKKEISSQLKHELPHLIFLDIRLGGEDGEEIARQLKGDQRTRSVPLVLLSADGKTEEIAGKVHANGFLLKPFDIDSLLTTVQTHIH